MIPRLLVAAGVAAFAFTPVGAAEATGVARHCGSASYGSPAPLLATEYGVSAVTAWKARCGKAMRVALDSEGHGGDVYVSTGYRCRPQPLHSGKRPYVCTRIKKPEAGAPSRVKFRTWGNS